MRTDHGQLEPGKRRMESCRHSTGISCFIILFLANFFTSKMFAWTIIKHQSKLGFVLFLTVVRVYLPLATYFLVIIEIFLKKKMLAKHTTLKKTKSDTLFSMTML